MQQVSDLLRVTSKNELPRSWLRSINISHSRGLLIGNAETMTHFTFKDTRFHGYHERRTPKNTRSQVLNMSLSLSLLPSSPDTRSFILQIGGMLIVLTKPHLRFSYYPNFFHKRWDCIGKVLCSLHVLKLMHRNDIVRVRFFTMHTGIRDVMLLTKPIRFIISGVSTKVINSLSDINIAKNIKEFS